MTNTNQTEIFRRFLVPALAVVLLLLSCGERRSTTASESASGSNSAASPSATPVPGQLLTGKAALGDWSTDAPGVRRKITAADLPPPFETKSVDNGPGVVARPTDAWPKAPAGFKVEQFVGGLSTPRLIRTAPNGDIFVAESYADRIRVIRPSADGTKPESNEIFISGVNKPFGIAFYPLGPNPNFVYIANTDSVVRVPYQNGDLKARGAAAVIVPDLPGGGRLRGGGHWTRDVTFSNDGARMFVSVGSKTNVYDEGAGPEERRADILEFKPDGTGYRMFATGIRNAVGIAVHPRTGDLWASVNERDGLGDDLAPDYVTRVKDGGFYGWPWYYIGPNEDPRRKGERPDLRDKVIVPDVLVQSHSASLEMTFYTGKQFPSEYALDAFASEHGSWNRERRTGYKVIRVKLNNGVPNGEYEDFVTGFVTAEGKVWGRPVGVTVAKDGSLLISDDGSNTIWRVSYQKK